MHRTYHNAIMFSLRIPIKNKDSMIPVSSVASWCNYNRLFCSNNINLVMLDDVLPYNICMRFLNYNVDANTSLICTRYIFIV